MGARRGTSACAFAATLLAALALSASASASASLTPFQRDYGNVTVESTSSSRTFIVTTLCDDNPSMLFYQCANPGGDPALPMSISISRGFTQTNDCPAAMPRAAGPAGDPVTTTCTIRVSFAPTEAGKAQGLLRTGTTAENPVAVISGTGVIPAAAKKKKKCKRAAKRPKRKCKRRNKK